MAGQQALPPAQASPFLPEQFHMVAGLHGTNVTVFYVAVKTGIPVLQESLHIWLGRHIISFVESLVIAKPENSLTVHLKKKEDVSYTAHYHCGCRSRICRRVYTPRALHGIQPNGPACPRLCRFVESFLWLLCNLFHIFMHLWECLGNYWNRWAAMIWFP